MDGITDIVREELVVYYVQTGTGKIHFYDIIELVKPAVEEAYPDLEFTGPRVRQGIKALHRQEEIKYIGNKKYRIQNPLFRSYNRASLRSTQRDEDSAGSHEPRAKISDEHDLEQSQIKEGDLVAALMEDIDL